MAYSCKDAMAILFQASDEAEDCDNPSHGRLNVVRLAINTSSDQNTDFKVTSSVLNFFQPVSTSPSSYGSCLKILDMNFFLVLFFVSFIQAKII